MDQSEHASEKSIAWVGSKLREKENKWEGSMYSAKKRIRPHGNTCRGSRRGGGPEGWEKQNKMWKQEVGLTSQSMDQTKGSDQDTASSSWLLISFSASCLVATGITQSWKWEKAITNCRRGVQDTVSVPKGIYIMKETLTKAQFLLWLLTLKSFNLEVQLYSEKGFKKWPGGGFLLIVPQFTSRAGLSKCQPCKVSLGSWSSLPFEHVYIWI